MAENKPILRNANGTSLVKGSGSLNPGGRPQSRTWRQWLRKETRNGEEIHQVLLDLMRGKPRIVTLLDGRQQVIIPSAEVMKSCAIHLDEMLHGKAVTQTEQQKAEREAGAMEAVRAMSDEELERQYLEARARRTRIEPEDAQLVAETVRWTDVFEAPDVALDGIDL